MNTKKCCLPNRTDVKGSLLHQKTRSSPGYSLEDCLVASLVGVVLDCEFAIRLLDLALGSLLGYAQKVVETLGSRAHFDHWFSSLWFGGRLR